jgi:hypothetical protein
LKKGDLGGFIDGYENLFQIIGELIQLSTKYQHSAFSFQPSVDIGKANPATEIVYEQPGL